jgi:exodeoxyribonuclease-3
MQNFKLISWNVNGIRATIKKGFWDIVKELNPDVISIQETKADDSIIQDLLKNECSYQASWHCNQLKKGYSGVATLSRIPLIKSSQGFGIERFDQEGRVIVTEYEKFSLINIYFPNGGQGPHRIEYKLEFYEACLEFMQQMRKIGKPFLLCGDVNTAHKEIDLHDPKGNINTTGFLPIERAWLDKLTEYNYLDTFREINPEAKDIYTWWDMRTRSRERNKGWRIDYFWIPSEFKGILKEAFILPEVQGSDHCPLGVVLEV